ncbi:helix-turn-helix domain-containing protein [Roseomonas sp. E05]|uniref:TetR/AcrR family transcriptional regulator n=1 Tax=Roseomonas sp. E05 TaxID=3046310 RepID=UPI0024B87D1B|nr:TetR/AcrR family transcriptional regulator [Roseomonas sp. E05]MDJ0388797.1 helix-turn-helix domain-containing protein [Roseomonas sp. E05]
MAARALVAEQGMAASLEAVARQAGLGIGTLYRHFPTREALVEALFREEHAALVAAADDLAARLPADEALARWLQRSLDYLATKRGLGDSLHQLLQARPDIVAAVQGGFPSAVARLLAAAIAQGSVRPDAEPEDILHTLTGIYSAPAGPDWRRRAGRIVGLLMDGLRARPEKALPRG